MASSSAPILARSLRTTLVLASSSASAAASTSATVPAASRTFTSSASPRAAAKKPAAPVRKVKQSPAAAAAAKRKAAFAKPSSVQLSRLAQDSDPSRPPGSLRTPFYRPPPEQDENAPTLSHKLALTDKALNTVVPFSKQHLDAFDKFGIKQHKPLHASLHSRYTPASLVRQATVDVVTQLHKLADGGASSSSSSSSPSNRIVLTGPRHGGKSQLLLQSVACALSADWVVVYIPRLTTYINSTSAYVYSAEEKVYLQPEIVRSLLSAIRGANSRSALQRVPVTLPQGTTQGPRGVAITESTTLLDVLSASTDSNRPLTALASQQVLDIVLHMLSVQTAVPTLLAIDDAQALYLPSLYRTPDYDTIQSYELGPLRSLLRFLASRGPARGTVLAALSQSNNGFPIPNELSAVLRESTTAHPKLPATLPDGRVPLYPPSGQLHPYAPIHALHLSHVRASRLSPWTVSDVWAIEELRALFTQRWREGRTWNMGGVDLGFGLTPPPSVRNKNGEVTSVAGAKDIPPVSARGGRGISSLDEYFTMRLVDSGRNPARFDKAVWGESML